MISQEPPILLGSEFPDSFQNVNCQGLESKIFL